MSSRIDALLREADEILAMAKDLQARGLIAESVAFAMAAAERLRAVRALQRLADA